MSDRPERATAGNPGNPASAEAPSARPAGEAAAAARDYPELSGSSSEPAATGSLDDSESGSSPAPGVGLSRADGWPRGSLGARYGTGGNGAVLVASAAVERRARRRRSSLRRAAERGTAAGPAVGAADCDSEGRRICSWSSASALSNRNARPLPLIWASSGSRSPQRRPAFPTSRPASNGWRTRRNRKPPALPS